MSMLTPLGRGRGRRERPRKRRSGPSGDDPARRRALALLVAIVVGGALAVWLIVQAADRQRVPHAASTPCAKASGVAPLTPKQIRVKVLNATSRAGLASTVAAELRRRGYTVLGVGNDSGTVAQSAVVRYGGPGAPAVKPMVAVVPGAVSRRDNRPTADIDLILGNSFTSLAPAKPAAACPAPT